MTTDEKLRAYASAFHLVFFGVILPLAVFRMHRRMVKGAKGVPDPKTHFRGATVELAALMTLSLLVARATRIDVLAFDRTKLLPGLAAGAAMYVVAVLWMRPKWRRAVEKRAPIVRLFMPRNAGERAWWIAVSVLAGIGEEITWRGVQTQLLVPIVGAYAVAALLSAISFGGAHFLQGWRSCLVIVFFALGFQAVVWASGSLFVAMAVHVAYDVTAGITYGRLGRELGYAAPEPGTRASSP
jgi:membrane protease YdiL (CAAX protease family)